MAMKLRIIYENPRKKCPPTAKACHRNIGGVPGSYYFSAPWRSVSNGLFDLFRSDLNRNWFRVSDYNRRQYRSNWDGCRHAKIQKSQTHADYFRFLTSIAYGPLWA